MAKITLSEASAPSTPDSGQTVIYVLADGKVYSKDDTGTVSDLTAGGGTTVASGASLGTAPSNYEFKVKTGPPDQLYVSMQKTGGTWDWVPVVFAP